MNKFAIAGLALAMGIGVVAKSQVPEVQRYLKIRKM